MPEETDCPYEDPEPPVTVLPLCTEATDPRPTRRLLLLGPGNGGGGSLQIGKVAESWTSQESSSL